MFVKLDEDGYVKFISQNAEIAGGIELPDDEKLLTPLPIDFLSCYKINETRDGLILDVEKVEVLKDSLGVNAKIYELKEQLAGSDYKVLRKIREDNLGIEAHLNADDYLKMEAQRESIVRQIRQLEDNSKLEIDANQILEEGKENRQSKEGEVSSIIKDIKAIEKTLKSNGNNIQTLNNFYNKLSEICQKLEDKANSLQTSSEAEMQSLNALIENTKTTLQEKITTLETTTNNLQNTSTTNIEDLQKQISTLSEQITTLSEQLNQQKEEQNEEIANLNTRIDNLNTDYA